MRLLHEEVCEECKQLSPRVVCFTGFHHSEDIAACKACVIKAYELIKKDEEKEVAESMRKIH